VRSALEWAQVRPPVIRTRRDSKLRGGTATRRIRPRDRARFGPFPAFDRLPTQQEVSDDRTPERSVAVGVRSRRFC
jgi:hypothetical protein